MSYIKTNKFESRFKIGEYVVVKAYGLNPLTMFGTIASVKFEDLGKVKYDIYVGGNTDAGGILRLYDIPGDFILPMAEHAQNIAKSELSNV